jgi:hypothetical protein
MPFLLLALLLSCNHEVTTEYVCKDDGFIYYRRLVDATPLQKARNPSGHNISCDEHLHPEPRFTIDEWRDMAAGRGY